MLVPSVTPTTFPDQAAAVVDNRSRESAASKGSLDGPPHPVPL
jgi:hypothetical protein